MAGYRMNLTFHSIWETSSELGRTLDMKPPTEFALSQALWIPLHRPDRPADICSFYVHYPVFHRGLYSRQAKHLCDEVRNNPFKPTLCSVTSAFRGCLC